MNTGWFLHDLLEFIDNELKDGQDLEDFVKDELADAKEKGFIGHCGCEDYFKIEKVDGGVRKYDYSVFMVINSKMTKFSITYDEAIGGGDVTYEGVNRQDVIEGYGEIEFNEYVDESPTYTNEDIAEYFKNVKR